MKVPKFASSEVFQIATGLAATLGGFVLPPPAGMTADTKQWSNLGGFVILVFSGLVLAFGAQMKHRSHAGRWVSLSALSLLIGVAGFFVYHSVAGARTCRYYTEVRIIGTVLTPSGSDYASKNPSATCQDILKAFTGDADQAWTALTVKHSELLLGLTYTAILPFLALAALASTQAYRCSKSRS
jgi:hypothetical protein